MTVFGTALFSARFQCLIWAGVCELAVNVHSYELAEIELGSSCEYFLHYAYYIAFIRHLTDLKLPCGVFIVSKCIFHSSFLTSHNTLCVSS